MTNKLKKLLKLLIIIILLILSVEVIEAYNKEVKDMSRNFDSWNAQTYSTRVKAVDDFQTRGYEIQAIHETGASWMPLVEETEIKQQDF